jgi:type II secretory pathway pseudopilin PulG
LTAHLTTCGSVVNPFFPATRKRGYTIILLLFVLAAMSIGLMLAVPVWQTQIMREKEEELIFRGKQYVEAIRIYQVKNPGKFPASLEELIDPEERCIRKLYPDPMTINGEWKVILMPTTTSSRPGQTQTAQKVIIAPQGALSAINAPKIAGVVSASTETSIRIYLEQDTYDRWLFFYGQDPNSLPEIIEYGKELKE